MAYDPKTKSGIATPPVTTESEWQGPIYASTDLSLVTVINTIYSIHDGDGGLLDSSFAELLPLYIMNEHSKKNFMNWKAKTGDALCERFPFNSTDPWGSPISKEFMNTEKLISVQENEEAVSSYLDKIKKLNNPFIEFYTNENN